MFSFINSTRFQKLLTGLALSSGLAACGGGGSVEVGDNIDTSVGGGPAVIVYDGPSPQTDDVQNFKLNVWDNLVADNRCGACHTTGGQAPTFVRTDNINTAYAVANPLIDLDNPASSRLVTKVAGGHNCWLDVDSVCGDILTGYVSDWAADGGSNQNTVILTAPSINEVGSSKSFPADSTGFSDLHDIFTTYCASCHSEDSNLQQQPFFASNDINLAFEASKSKIDLGTPSRSRFVQRLGSEFHNCWDSCSANAATVEQAIQDYADDIPETVVDPDLVISKAMTLGRDGIVASAGGRVENNLIALYEFKAGTGSTAFDTSGIEPATNLNLIGDVEWLASWGIRINDGKAQASTATSRKLYDLITATSEYSIEAWLVPDNVTQDGPARIVTYAGASEARNFMLGQTLYNYDFLNRTESSDLNGDPALSTADADERLQATLQHVVVTYSPVSGRRIYVNGEYTGDVDGEEPAGINSWDASYAFAVGNEVSNDAQWRGSLRLLAVYNRVMAETDIAANFEAGVGEKFFLLFSIGHLIDAADSYIVFEVQQFDDYSYLFNAPFFTSLSGDVSFTAAALEGMRIGVNGNEAAVGQAFAKLNTEINAANIVDGRQVLSPIGTIISLDLGAEDDEFFLSFDRLGTHDSVRVAATVPALPTPEDNPDQAHIGVRRFAEINASLAAITGVSTAETAVAETYNLVRQQLPLVESIDGFLAAHQMGVTQLAVEYCSALVGEQADIDTSRRDSYFSGFDFDATPDIAFSVAGRDALIAPLVAALAANELPTDASHPTSEPLATQPLSGAIADELNSLIDAMLTACPGACATESDRTLKVAKATCAAAAGSAVMLLQ